MKLSVLIPVYNVEAYLDEFIRNVLKLLGFDNEVWHYQRAVEINQTEAINNAIAAAPFMGDEATTKKLCELFGMIDSFEEIQRSKIADGYNAFNSNENSLTSENEGEVE